MEPTPNTRKERDSMGEIDVPADAYYGASTARAVLNFPISDLRMPASLIRALGFIKLAAAKANTEFGLLEPATGDAIARAALEIADGHHVAQFPVDVFQTGSGTSTNMNANEVIANRAAELLGIGRGARTIHPNDHVNLGQSSNDVIPTAIHLAALMIIREHTVPALQRLENELEDKATEFWGVIKTGRTHLQDATPIRLGQEFRGYAGQVQLGLQRLEGAEQELLHVALGGTAVGTGVGAHPQFTRRALAYIHEMTGFAVVETQNHFIAQSTIDPLLNTSGILRTIAIDLMKIANDVRWMASGPRTGLGELRLPGVQPGSSIMPGKVNPVIAESLIQVAAQVIGNDAAIATAAQGGYFELNTMMPVAAYNLLQSLSLLAAAANNFASQCIRGIEATERGPSSVAFGLGLATSLVPVIGYDAAARIAYEAVQSERSILDVASERLPMSRSELEEVLKPENML